MSATLGENVMAPTLQTLRIAIVVPLLLLLVSSSRAIICKFSYETRGALANHTLPTVEFICPVADAREQEEGSSSATLPREMCFVQSGHLLYPSWHSEKQFSATSQTLYGCFDSEHIKTMKAFARLQLRQQPVGGACYRFVSENADDGYHFRLCLCDSDNCNSKSIDWYVDRLGIRETFIIDIERFEDGFDPKIAHIDKLEEARHCW